MQIDSTFATCNTKGGLSWQIKGMEYVYVPENLSVLAFTTLRHCGKCGFPRTSGSCMYYSSTREHELF